MKHGEQLRLRLDLGPWDGRSPRYLTKVHRSINLPHEGAPRPVQSLVDAAQYKLDLKGESFNGSWKIR